MDRPSIYDPANLRGIGDNGRNSGTLGNIILKALGAVNWQGTGGKEVEALFAISDEYGVGCGMSCKPTMSAERCSRCEGRAENQKLQRGWERNTLLSLYFGPAPKTLVDPKAAFNSLKGTLTLPLTLALTPALTLALTPALTLALILTLTRSKASYSYR